MFCNLNYSADKDLLSKYFYSNYSRTAHHKTAGSEITYWRKLFNVSEVADPVLKDLGLYGANVVPRFSFQYRMTRLEPHIDVDRIVGININLMDRPATLHMQGMPYEYECCLVDVGSIVHSVEPLPRNRLILKLAFREPWDELYKALKPKFILDDSADSYVSVLSKEDEQFVKL